MNMYLKSFAATVGFIVGVVLLILCLAFVAENAAWVFPVLGLSGMFCVAWACIYHTYFKLRVRKYRS